MSAKEEVGSNQTALEQKNVPQDSSNDTTRRSSSATLDAAVVNDKGSIHSEGMGDPALVDLEKSKEEPNTAASGSPFVNPRAIHGVRWVIVFMAIISTAFLYALDNTIVSVAIAPIVDDFQQPNQLPWLSVGFILGGASMILPAGRIFATFNVKYAYLTGVTLFLAGSALCGGAPTINALIVGRVIAGVGGNMLYFGVMTLMTILCTPQELPNYIGFVVMTWAVGSLVGPAIGGAFISNPNATWRWAFYINLVIGGAFSPIYILMIPSTTLRPNEKIWPRVKELDYAGIFLSIAAIILFIIPTSTGGVLYAWDSAAIIVMYVLSGLLFIAVGIQQSYSFLTTRRRRIFPVHFFLNRSLVVLAIETATAAEAAFLAIYYIPIYFQFVEGVDALSSAKSLLPLIFSLVVGALVAGASLPMLPDYRILFIVGPAFYIAGSAVLVTLSAQTSHAIIYGMEVLIGLGAGLSFSGIFGIGPLIVSLEDQSYTLSFSLFFQLFGITTGLSIAGAVFVNLCTNRLSAALPNTSLELIQLAIAGASGPFLASLPDQQTKTLVLDIIISCLSRTFIVGLTGGVVAFLAAFGLKKENLDGLKKKGGVVAA